MAIKLAWMLALVGAGLLLLFWLGQRKLMYVTVDGAVAAVERALPGGREVSFRTDDGLTLAGWWLPAEEPAHGALIVCNGNAGHRGYRAGLAAAFARRGFDVLLFDYRGYGGNPGKPSEEGLRRDLRAARRWLEGRPGVDPERVALLGESLGAAVALAEAAERPPAAVVLRSPFYSGVRVAGHHFPLLPIRLLLRDRWRSDRRVRGLDSPLLVVAGGADRIVPADQSRALFDAATTPDKEWLLLDGVGHNDAVFATEGDFVAATAEFLRTRLSRSGSFPQG